MSAKDEMVIARAANWWKHRRPIGWNLEQHLANPQVNCTTDAEAALARSVARMITASEEATPSPDSPVPSPKEPSV
jgi:hypothetical protein